MCASGHPSLTHHDQSHSVNLTGLRVVQLLQRAMAAQTMAHQKTMSHQKAEADATQATKNAVVAEKIIQRRLLRERSLVMRLPGLNRINEDGDPDGGDRTASGSGRSQEARKRAGHAGRLQDLELEGRSPEGRSWRLQGSVHVYVRVYGIIIDASHSTVDPSANAWLTWLPFVWPSRRPWNHRCWPSPALAPPPTACACVQ